MSYAGKGDASPLQPATSVHGTMSQVVPFSPAAGLLEWVEETIPLSEYLNGPDRASGAHARYARPGALPFLAAFEHLHRAVRQAQGQPSDAELRRAFDEVLPQPIPASPLPPAPHPQGLSPGLLRCTPTDRTYTCCPCAAAAHLCHRHPCISTRLGPSGCAGTSRQDSHTCSMHGSAHIRRHCPGSPPRQACGVGWPGGAQVCARFRPCLHNFFLETFRAPAAWFEARLAYARATAVSSMAGYLIGLGDRHSANILLDRRSAQAPLRAACCCAKPGAELKCCCADVCAALPCLHGHSAYEDWVDRPKPALLG